MRLLGLAAIACYVLHAIELLFRGQPYDLLWGCHVAVLLVAAGLLSNNASLNAIGLLWSCFGLPLWLIYVFTDNDFMLTSTLTHVGAFIIGIYGVRRMGIPRGVAWKAVGAYLALWALTRVVTPESANVNLAFSVWPGWENRFPTYPIYFVTLLASGTLTFAISEMLFRKVHLAATRPGRT